MANEINDLCDVTILLKIEQERVTIEYIILGITT